MDSKKSNICVFCKHARDRLDVAGVYCVGGFWKKDDGTCEHFKEYQAGAAPAPSMNREELVKDLREASRVWISDKGLNPILKPLAERYAEFADLLENDQRKVDELLKEIECQGYMIDERNHEIERLKKYEDKCHDCPIVCAKTEILKAHEEIDALRKQLETVTAERDAAVEDLRKLAREHCVCYACKNDKFDYDKGVCIGCQYNNWNNWEWRGVQKEG